MKMKDTNNNKTFAKAMADALREGSEEKFTQAFENFTQEIENNIKAEYETIKEETDSKILASRGYRQLTSKERIFYEKWIESAKSSNPKQAFIDLIESDGMPETIIEDVFVDLTTEHPLLSKIDFIYVKYLTQWLLNDQSTSNYAWGEIDAKIVSEITAAFKNIKLEQAQLTSFMQIGLGMLELGPRFLDAYIRRSLKEVTAVGLEFGIAYGNGLNCMIGLSKNISKGVSIDTTKGYPNKTAIKVTDFTPKTYGSLVAKLAKSETEKKRSVTGLTMLVNPVDYLTKIMPATTVLNANGTYTNNLFPIPTDVIESEVIKDNEAILFLPKHYFVGIGHSKDGVITYSDEYKFLENVRTYKSIMYAAGKAKDNNVAVVLDISELNPSYLNVKLLNPIVIPETNEGGETA